MAWIRVSRLWSSKLGRSHDFGLASALNWSLFVSRSVSLPKTSNLWKQQFVPMRARNPHWLCIGIIQSQETRERLTRTLNVERKKKKNKWKLSNYLCVEIATLCSRSKNASSHGFFSCPVASWWTLLCSFQATYSAVICSRHPKQLTSFARVDDSRRSAHSDADELNGSRVLESTLLFTTLRLSLIIITGIIKCTIIIHFHYLSERDYQWKAKERAPLIPGQSLQSENQLRACVTGQGQHKAKIILSKSKSLYIEPYSIELLRVTQGDSTCLLNGIQSEPMGESGISAHQTIDEFATSLYS